jgi:hypothetical protein
MGMDVTQEQGPDKRRGTSEKTIQLDVIYTTIFHY